VTGISEDRSDGVIHEWPEWDFCNRICAILEELKSAAGDADSIDTGCLYPLLDSTIGSTSSLRLLAAHEALRDAYVVSRTIYETSVNACFITTDIVGLSSRARIHANQKALRSLVRKIEIAGRPLFEFKHPHAEELLQRPDHKGWLDQFTSKSGREITSWTPENVQQRLEAVHLKFGEKATRGLAYGLLLYRHASEISHGTLYGTLFSWGAMETHPLKSPKDIGNFRRAELRHVLRLVCFTLESLICICSVTLSRPDLGEAATEARREYYRNRKEKGNKNDK
jgi:hypothetical protein